MNAQQNVTMSPRAAVEKKYAIARHNLLLMMILTVVNIILYIAGSDTMMLFSATVPYLAAGIGIESQYGPMLAVGMIIAVICLALYLLCWIFSKKHFAWMITAAVMFGLDTLAMAGLYLLMGEVSGILDAVIHVWVMYYLIMGAVNGYKLKNMPAEIPAEFSVETETSASQPNTAYMRLADMDTKARILLEEEVLGHRVCYRRVKRVNELVIDGYVYDDVEMLVETAHSLNANVDGHQIQVGFDGATSSYLRVDGETVKRKTRLW